MLRRAKNYVPFVRQTEAVSGESCVRTGRLPQRRRNGHAGDMAQTITGSSGVNCMAKPHAPRRHPSSPKPHFQQQTVILPESHSSSFSRVRVDSAGRVVIPGAVRRHLGIEPGEDLILSEDESGIRLQTFEQAVKAAREAFAPYRVPGVSVVDDLIREREEEARRDYGE